MKTPKRVLKYAAENFDEVLHTTLNPEGPGVVRIHLVPPVIENDEVGSAIAIINGQDIIPIGPSWTVLLAEFIKEVNSYSGKEVTEEESRIIMENTCNRVRKVYPLLRKKIIREDVYRIMTAFSKIAYGECPDEDVEYMSIGEYAPLMRAPHRMDLLVSAMTKDGKWHCNQNCIHCYAAGQELVSEKELTTDEWKKIIDKCRNACIPQLTFTGGEPTMREDLVELIDYSKWFVTRLNTNGIKLTGELCEQLKAASLDSCQVTFYSCDEAIHNELVGAPQFANTVDGIKNAIATGINLSINTPLCTLNKDYIKTLQFLKELGVMYVTCSGLIITGNACNDNSKSLQLSGDELKEVLKAAVDYCAENGMEISFTSPGWIEEDFFEELGINKPTCGACLSNMAITPGGNAVPCQSHLSDEPLGNMLNDDWDVIWNSQKCIEHRDYSAMMTGLCPLRRKDNE